MIFLLIFLFCSNNLSNNFYLDVIIAFIFITSHYSMTPTGSHEIMCVFISWLSMVPHWQPWNKVIIFHGNISLFHDNNHAGITSPFVFVSASVLLMHFWELIFFAEIFITTRFTTFFCLWVILITHYALVGIDLFRIFDIQGSGENSNFYFYWLS